MPRDQFARVKPGEQLGGLPSQPWNALLDLVKPGGLGPGAGDGRADNGVEFRVVNTTGAAIPRFGILQVNAPLNLQSTAPDLFYGEDVLKGVAPAADKPFVVFQEPVVAGGVGRARLSGLTKGLVAIGTSGHRWAGPTTATNKLTSQAGLGPAYIVHPTSGTGDTWCTLLLTGAIATKAAFINFTLPSALATTDASKASCTVNFVWGAGADPGSTVTVYNQPASSNYMFSGASGNRGVASYDPANDKYFILQMQCP
jgi:hypothetical protein